MPTSILLRADQVIEEACLLHVLGTFRTCRVALTMSVDGGKADLVLGRIGAFLFRDGRESRYFYWDDVRGRRLRPEILTREQALEAARALARAEQDKPTNCSSRPPGAGNHRFL